MTTHQPPLPEVERIPISASYFNGKLQDAVDVVRASTFDAHVAELRSAVRLLREHVRHAKDCQHGPDYRMHVMRPCSCGASQALAETERFK